MFVAYLGIMIVLGLIVTIIAAAMNKNLLFLIGCIVAVGGGIYVKIELASEHAAKRADLESRIFHLTQSVTETNRTTETTKESGPSGCVQRFKLATVPGTFEVKCEVFFDGADLHYPEIGDIMRVKFIAPKPQEANGTPEVLEFYNLTQEMARVRSTPAAEAPSSN